MLSENGSKQEGIIRVLPKLILLYCIIQPILDVAGYWLMQWQLENTATLVLRMLLLLGSVLLGFLLSEHKTYYFLMAGCLLALTGFHVIANLPGGYREGLTDLVNLLRIYLMPMTALCFITFLRRGGEPCFQAMKKGLFVNLCIIGLVELLSVVTGTDPHTYKNEGGVLGWFVWTSSQSAILSMLAPISLCYVLQRPNSRIRDIVLINVAVDALLYFFGTRLTFAAMIATGVGVGFCLLLADKHKWKQTVAILLVTTAFTCAYPFSPNAQRMEAVIELNQENGERIEEMKISPLPEVIIPPEDSEEPDPVTNDASESADPHPTPNISREDWEKMKKVYHGYLYGVTQRFGYQRVMEKYHYSFDAAILGNWRTKKIYFCEMLMEDGNWQNLLFGLNLQDMREYVKYGVKNEKTGVWEDGWLNYDVENDFHGIYFLLGIIGLLMMLGFLLYFGLRAFLCVIRDFKCYFTTEMIGFAGAYVFALVHAYFTASILRRNNASVYLALVLAGLWYLTQRKNQSNSHA